MAPRIRLLQKVDTRSDFGSTLHERRLRALVQSLNVRFAKAMCKCGLKYKFNGLVSLEDDGPDGDTSTPPPCYAPLREGSLQGGFLRCGQHLQGTDDWRSS
jgi:hypothetical protein